MSQVLISSINHHERVVSFTVVSWIKQLLVLSGIDMNKFPVHSDSLDGQSQKFWKGVPC